MSEEIEKIIKLQGIINRNRYHLSVRTDLEKECEWRLYQVFRDINEYLSFENTAILSSRVDTVEDLLTYLKKHDGYGI